MNPSDSSTANRRLNHAKHLIAAITWSCLFLYSIYLLVDATVSAPLPIARLLMGFAVDREFALQLRELTHLELSLVASGDGTVPIWISTLPDSAQALLESQMEAASAMPERLDDSIEHYFGQHLQLTSGPGYRVDVLLHKSLTEAEAGIEVTIPAALVEFDHYEPPFVHFRAKDGANTRLVLISTPGSGFNQFLLFIGNSVIALLLATLLSFWTLGIAQGFNRESILKFTNECLAPTASITLLVGAGGGLNRILVEAGVTDQIVGLAHEFQLSPLIMGWLFAALMRIATGSATVALTTASGVVAPVAVGLGYPHPELLVIATGADTFDRLDADMWCLAIPGGNVAGRSDRCARKHRVVVAVGRRVVVGGVVRGARDRVACAPRAGAWRSLVSVPALGAGGRRFESGRPDSA